MVIVEEKQKDLGGLSFDEPICLGYTKHAFDRDFRRFL